MDTTAASNNRLVVYRGKPQRERPRVEDMPWTGPEFARKHNKSLTRGEAKSAARQATAMVGAGVDEGIAIATANKRINRLRRRGAISDKQHRKLGSKYSSKDDNTPIDAAGR